MVRFYISIKKIYKFIDIIQKLVIFFIVLLVLANIPFNLLKFEGDITLLPGTNSGEVNIDYNILGFQLFRESNNSNTDDIRHFGTYLGQETYIGGFFYFLGIFFAFFSGNLWRYRKIKSKSIILIILCIITIIITIGPLISFSSFQNLVNIATIQDEELKNFYPTLIYSYSGRLSQNLIHFITYPIIFIILEILISNIIFNKIKSLKKDFWKENLNKNFTDININDVREIIRRKVKESTYLDYKEDYPQKNEKLAQLMTSFANTEGGYIIIGVNEEIENNKNTGIPDKLLGVNRIDHKLRLTNIAIDNSNPKIVPNVKTFQISDKQKKDIVIVQIKKSIEPIMFTGTNTYYRRINDQTRKADHEWVASRFLKFF